MIPWQHLDSTTVPGDGGTMTLHRRGDEFSIRVGSCELMNSRAHGSEETLAQQACQRLSGRPQLRVLIGGLGLGFTLRAALDALPAEAEVVVAELVPAVVRWNREIFGHLAGQPLTDPRVQVMEGDVGRAIRAAKGGFDAILLDVDNGPEGLTAQTNDRLYSAAGLKAACSALRPGGVLAVWSADPCPPFTARLQKAGFRVDEVRARARGRGKGGRHVLWFGVKKP